MLKWVFAFITCGCFSSKCNRMFKQNVYKNIKTYLSNNVTDVLQRLFYWIFGKIPLKFGHVLW